MARLTVTRRSGESIVIGDDVTVTVVSVQGGKAVISVTAPKRIEVDRMEVRYRKNAEVKR